MGARSLAAARWWGARDWTEPPFDYTIGEIHPVRQFTWRSGLPVEDISQAARIAKVDVASSVKPVHSITIDEEQRTL